jgi:hypothetical protein
MRALPRVLSAALLLALPLALFACSSSSSSTPTGATGGAVAGAADTHCTTPTPTAQATNASSCQPPPTGDAGPSEVGADAGMDDAMDMPEFGATEYGTEGDDDDCKYHVKWTSTAVRQGQDVTFTVTITNKTDGKATTGAAPDAEVFLSSTHPAPNSGQKASEPTPGTYAVGPIRFDASGRWTVRFHLFETCSDRLEDSPHGHAAFYVDVP